jgi:hypothetical protein
MPDKPVSDFNLLVDEDYIVRVYLSMYNTVGMQKFYALKKGCECVG